MRRQYAYFVLLFLDKLYGEYTLAMISKPRSDSLDILQRQNNDASSAATNCNQF